MVQIPGGRSQGAGSRARTSNVQRSTLNVDGGTGTSPKGCHAGGVGLRRSSCGLGGAGFVFLTAIVVVPAFSGCQTTGTAQPAPEALSFEVARETLSRPLPGPFVALYRLRVPSTGGLRLSVIADGGRGRMTVSESLGGAVVVAGWDDHGSEIFDLRKGCRLQGDRAVAALGLGNLPLSRAVLLLGGRAPALQGDRVRTLGQEDLLEIAGAGWWAVAELAREPSRIITLRGEDWEAELDDHTSSVPGSIRIETPSGDWAELELVRLQWEFSGDLPSLPDLPVCGS